eukprot:GFYU01015526.1.p1 GENE.GFYU01015526.1~~GFYU01015526.1.p1  ORF type:complete len:494 (-),score=163.97 GFYU01015526.1:200-1645(-)
MSRQLRDFYPCYVAGKPVTPENKLSVLNKYTNEHACNVALADEALLDQAIAASVKAFPAMRDMPNYQKKEILTQLANDMRGRIDEFAYAICIEAGKSMKDALGEVDRAISTIEVAAEEAVRIYGEHIPLDIAPRSKGMEGIVRRFPIGPVAMISPFNFPLNLALHKIAPAIAAGCSFVLKPASRTPICALLLGELLTKTSMPEGSWSILPTNRVVGNMLNSDPRLKLITFTGSPAVGWQLKATAGKKKVVLELGGNAACVCTEDTDVDFAVGRIIFGAFYQSGQSCISVQRVYVHESIYEQTRDKLVAATKVLKSGDPFDPETFITPMIAETEAQRLEGWVQAAVAAGGKLLTGGSRNRSVLEATIVEDCPHNVDLYTKEAFGPAFTLEKYTDFKTLVELINESDYGIQAGIFTKDLNKAFYAYQELEVGGVVIGDVPSVRVDSQPYGGVKDSGFGREGIRYAIEDMCEYKILSLKNASVL